MTRSKVCWFGLVVLSVSLLIAGSAVAGVFIEPEIGGRFVSADWGDIEPQLEGSILGPGITLGGNIGFKLNPVLALVAHADFGLHRKPEGVKLEGYPGERLTVTESGASLALLVGGRVYPVGGMPDMPLQPYLGLGVGLGSIAWEYESDLAYLLGEDADGAGALLVAVEAGGDLRVTGNVSLGASLRYIHYTWADESVNETVNPLALSEHSFGLTAHMGFHF